MEQAVICRPVIVHAQVRCQVCTSKFCSGQSGRGTIFCQSSSVSPCQYHSTKAPDSPSSKCCSYQKDKQEKAGDLPKRKTLSEIWELAVIFLPSYILNGNHLIKSCNFCWNVQETVPRLFVRSKFINTLLLPLHASGLKIAGCKRTWNEVKGWTALWT